MGETKIEQIARTLSARHYVERFGYPETSEIVQKNVDANWHLWVDDARASVEAMGDLTDAMREAMAEAVKALPATAERDLNRIYIETQTAWFAGIKAALAEQT